LSLKYSYRGRRGYLAGRYYRGVNRSGGRGGGSKGKKLFYLLLLALFILAALFSPVLKDTFSTRGKESVENIPLLLLAYSIPGMGLKADIHELREDGLSGNKADEKMPAGFSAMIGSHEGDDTVGASFVPIQEIAFGEIGDLFAPGLPESMPGGIEAISTGIKPPRVLIYHTHTSESFLPSSGEAFSDDMDKTVAVLGKYLAEILEGEYGFTVLHHCEIFDVPRRCAYEKARPSVESVLAEHPEIKVVLDLHRDGVSRSITTATIDGKDTGRILFVLGSGHPGWNNNLRFALFLQDALEEVCPGLSRGIRKQPFTYNQHLHQRSLIVEVGGHENSVLEVQRAIPFLAKALATVM
jgi:stage II sporulation protein P